MFNKRDRNEVRKIRHERVRKKISGTSDCPRLCVYRSNAHIYAQVIDDVAGNTLVAASTVEKEIASQIAEMDKKGASKLVGKVVAERALAKGIDIPVTAGIMPVVNARQIRRIVRLSNATLPQRFLAILDRFADDPDSMEKAGIAYATDQIIDMVANGVNRIHLYTMNNPTVARRISESIANILACVNEKEG